MVASPKEIDWLILGGEGQLALSLQKVLIEKQVEFVALARSEVDVSDADQVANIHNSYLPRVIFNGAAWTDVEGAEENEELATKVNAIGAANVAALASQIGATLIHISTDYVFSGDETGERAENEIPAPLSAYGRSKAAGEKYVLTQPGLDFYIVRTAWLYGPNGRNFVKTMVRKALGGEDEVSVIADQWGQPTSADDLAEQIYQMVKSKLPFGIYHGTNSGRATWHDFAKEIFQLVGADTRRVVPIASSSYPSKVRRPANSVLGHAKWIESGFTPMRDWRLALADALPALVHVIKVEE